MFLESNPVEDNLLSFPIAFFFTAFVSKFFFGFYIAIVFRSSGVSLVKTDRKPVRMKTLLLRIGAFAMLFFLFFASPSQGQSSSKSLLINHGGKACSSNSPEEHFFADALTTNPGLLLKCNVGMAYYRVFVAYNPADHKVYYADINGTGTKVYAMDFNLGGSVACPSGSTPIYTYNYTLNQLCFDNYGNNYGFANFNATAGTATLSQVNITTGVDLPGSQRTVKFPAAHIPNTVGDGDIVISPNGRIFATFGNSPSILYELTSATATGPITANFLTNLPRTCYSIAFVDGSLVVAGFNSSACYYYIWNINNSSLSSAFSFPGGKNSADMSNLTLAVGCTKKIIGANYLTVNSATIFYQLVIKNKGNIVLNNVQLTDDLKSVFGAGNVSNVHISFASNPAGLVLNPSYNGTTDINLLAPAQVLNNYPVNADSAVINLEVTASNLINAKIYYNSGIASGNIGTGATLMSVSDSSNNGGANKMDLNGNGVSDDANEDVPTPFVFLSSTLPVEGILLKGTKTRNETTLTWSAPGAETYVSYEVEKSTDGDRFEKVESMDAQTHGPLFTDNTAAKSEAVFYRIRATKADGSILYSNTLYLKGVPDLHATIYPNPFSDVVSVEIQATGAGIGTVQVHDMTGKLLQSKTVKLEKGTNYFSLPEMKNAQPGVYFLELTCGGEKSFAKLVKQ